MERTSRGGGRVWTDLNESHEMRRNGEKFSWDLKILKIPRGDKIQRDFSPINANAATISQNGRQGGEPIIFCNRSFLIQAFQVD